MDHSVLIAKLQAWKEYDFHADRQLADEVLIADGWGCVPDKGWAGGVRWFRPGFNPEISVCEDQRPHVINDLDTALAVVPSGHSIKILITPGIGAGAKVWVDGGVEWHTATAPIATIAVLIAALKAKQALEAV